MPLHWTIDSGSRFLNVVAKGDVSRPEVERLLDEMATREAMGPQDLLALGVRMRAYHALGPMGPLALALPDKKAEVVVPILGMLAAADRPMRIFETIQKARRWLGSLGGPLPRSI